MANEQAIAALQALKAEPGILMRWQEDIQRIIDTLNAPPAAPPPQPVPEPVEEDEPHAAAKSKVTTAAHASHAAHKGK